MITPSTVFFVFQVIQRIFYNVNRSWTGKITCSELRKSNFLQVHDSAVSKDVCWSSNVFKSHEIVLQYNLNIEMLTNLLSWKRDDNLQKEN